MWHITSEDCVYKCKKCGKEKKVNIGYDSKHITEEKCCGKKMEFRYWTDRSDIYHEE